MEGIVIEEENQGPKVTLVVKGSLSAKTAPDFEKELMVVFSRNFVKELILDLSELSYISSMGLRVILMGFKKMNERKGRLLIPRISPAVREVFAVSGFVDLFVQDEKLALVEKARNNRKAAVSLAGVLDASTVPILKDSLRQLQREGIWEIVLDMAKINGFDSEGAEAILDTQNLLKEKGGSLLLENTSQEIRENIRQTDEIRKKKKDFTLW